MVNWSGGGGGCRNNRETDREVFIDRHFLPIRNTLFLPPPPPPSSLPAAMDPEALSPMVTFALSPAAPILAPRVGSLAIAGRKPLATPHYIPLSSRGALPHISHDVLRDHTMLNSIYVGLEDCMISSTLLSNDY
jgi:hypothetical protein